MNLKVKFQLNKEYMTDLLKLCSITNAHDAQRAGSEVVKHADNPKLSGLLYPLMQALDEQYLEVDIQYGGIDQRKILMYAREFMPKIGYKPRIEIMTPLIPGLIGKKMSASDPSSKIDLLDDPKSVQKKLNKAETKNNTKSSAGAIHLCPIFPVIINIYTSSQGRASGYLIVLRPTLKQVV